MKKLLVATVLVLAAAPAMAQQTRYYDAAAKASAPVRLAAGDRPATTTAVATASVRARRAAAAPPRSTTRVAASSASLTGANIGLRRH